jgi:hypothetical protein
MFIGVQLDRLNLRADGLQRFSIFRERRDNQSRCSRPDSSQPEIQQFGRAIARQDGVGLDPEVIR